MDSEDFNEDGTFKRKSGGAAVLNNNSTNLDNGADPWYSVGIIGVIDYDETSNQSTPTPPRSPPVHSILSSSEKFESPDSMIHQEKKRLRNGDKYLTNSSPIVGDTNAKDNLFDCISDEIILYIFSLVPKSVLATLSIVCKRFRDLCLDDSLWPRVDLAFNVLPVHTLGYVLTRGVKALRLNSSSIKHPVFEPSLFFKEEYIFKVQYLDLSAVVISVKDLEQLMNHCRNLKKLSIETCQVSDNVCRQIALNEKIDTLDMAMCQGLTVDGLQAIALSCTRLENINLAWCNLSPAAVSNFCLSVSPRLTTVDLSGCLKSLSNEDVEVLVSRCPDITELDVSDCIRLTGHAIVSIVKHLDNLQSLSISRSYKITALAMLQLNMKASLCSLNMFGNMMGNMYPADLMKMLKSTLHGVAINGEMMGSIARPTVGIRRTSIWGIRCRE